MKRTLGFIACLLGVACLIFSVVLAALHAVGTDPGLFHALQMKAYILEHAGISEETLIFLDEALADCLKGNPDALGNENMSLIAEVFGEMQPAFNERERIHMEDCRRLFILLRQVLTATRIGGVVLTALGVVLLKDRRRLRLAAWLAPLLLVLPLGTFGVWMAMDFTAAFHFFHKILFTNDLWLLDPRTDLLIRICPSSMFANMGLRIGLTGLLGAIAIPAATTILSKFWPKRAK